MLVAGSTSRRASGDRCDIQPLLFEGVVDLLLAVVTFGTGFVMRPLDSLVSGNYADRHGRKAAMTLILSLMSLGVMMVAFAPTYAQAGIFAPIVLIAGRLLQTFPQATRSVRIKSPIRSR